MSDLTKYLVRVDKLQDEYHPGVVFANARREAFGVPTIAQDSESTPSMDFHFYEVADVDIDVAISHLTSRHPGVEIVVYAPIKSGIRPAGELVSKSISKDGVLP